MTLNQTPRSSTLAAKTSGRASASKKAVDALTAKELDAHVLAVRQRFASTLDAIEDKGNLPKQFKRSADKRASQLRALRRDKPAVFAAVVVGGAAVAVGILALVVKNATKR